MITLLSLTVIFSLQIGTFVAETTERMCLSAAGKNIQHPRMSLVYGLR